MIRTGAYGDWFGAVPDGLSLAKLEANPHGIDLGPLAAPAPRRAAHPERHGRAGRPRRSSTTWPGSRPRWPSTATATWCWSAAGTCARTTRGCTTSNVLVKGKERCTLQVHPDDAANLGLVDGGQAEVASRVGKLVAPVEVTDAIRPGVVSLPHGWGHDRARRPHGRRRRPTPA